MSPEIAACAIARQLEEYCGIHVKEHNSFNFGKVLERICPGAEPPLREEVLLEIIDALVIHETYFFRESGYLPMVAEAVLSSRGVTRIASLGVSTGEEAYTIWMHLREQGLSGKAEVFGYDLSRGAISRAESGLYSHHSLRRVDARYRRYFASVGDGFLIDGEVRVGVRFSALNVLDEGACAAEAERPFNIIVARNFFIYFSGALGRIVANIEKMAAAGSFLVTTPVENEKLRRLAPLTIPVIAAI